LVTLPIALPAGWIPPGDSSPIPWLLALLAVAVGLPFFAVSATSPVLQAWLADTDHAAAPNPHLLYAAGHAGSFLALLPCPLIIERLFPLGVQSRVWAWGYWGLVLLVAACALALLRARSVPARAPASGADAVSPAGAPARDAATARITAGRRAGRVVLAAAPPRLMLSVTTHISRHTAALPPLWVVPVAASPPALAP